MNNPMEQLQSFIKQGVSPEHIVKRMLSKNPGLQNIVYMAQSKNSKGIETFAKNMFKEQGRDFDKEFAEFMSYFK